MQTYKVRQRCHLARVPAFEIGTTRMEDFEKASITGHRWWTAQELAATGDLLRPAGLPRLFADPARRWPARAPRPGRRLTEVDAWRRGDL
ncbi:hypothetical protein [Nonomuraea sp. NPDC001023]|uniref:hypothetical protein n=1 Tax=unclassified Nonomuraea TaxID=2593643 RepID=UPI00332FC7B8